MQEYRVFLRNRRQFRYLWFAEIVSLAGDWFNTIAIIILVSRFTDSGLAIGTIFIARALPLFFLGPITGVVADKLNRRTILILSDLFRALIVLGFLFINSASLIWLAYVLTILQFSVSAFFEPAKSALVPMLVEEDELLIANTITNSTWSAMLAIGAALGGLAAGLFGTSFALIIDSASFLLSAYFVLKITANAMPVRSAEKHAQGGWMDMIEGFRYVMARPRIGVLTLVKGMSQIGTGDIMIALYAERVFHIGAGGALALGGMYTAFGLGAIAGPIMANMLGDGSDKYLQRMILIGFLIMPLGWFMFGTAPLFIFAMLGILLRGLGGSVNWTYSSVLIQKKVPNEYMGRVFALDFSIFTLCMAAAVWGTGFLVDTLHLEPRTIALYLALGHLFPAALWIYFIRGRLAPADTQIIKVE